MVAADRIDYDGFEACAKTMADCAALLEQTLHDTTSFLEFDQVFVDSIEISMYFECILSNSNEVV